MTGKSLTGELREVSKPFFEMEEACKHLPDDEWIILAAGLADAGGYRRIEINNGDLRRLNNWIRGFLKELCE